MKIKLVRIDDRLIHGQIISLWLHYAGNAQRILVVDDKAEKNPMLKSILRLAVPSGVEFVLKNKDDAINYINSDNSDKNTIMLIRNPKEAYLLVEKGFTPESINLGNISHTKSDLERYKLLDYLFVTTEDLEYLEKIQNKGIGLDVRAIPDERSKNLGRLVKRMEGEN